MSSQALKKMIDRMVEQSIREILPTVMNEVLVRTLASSGALTERKRRAPRAERRVQEAAPRSQRPQKAPKPQKRKGHRDLDDILSEIRDESVGADFFQDPRQLMTDAPAPDDDGYEPPPVPAQRLQSLPPELRGLAEGMQLDEDPEEMWDSEIGDSAPVMTHDPHAIRDVDRAAKAVGIDFSRMKSVVGATSPKPVANRQELAEAARAKAQFEQNRINRMREKLGGVKPLAD